MPGETFSPLSSRGRKPSCAAGWALKGGINGKKKLLFPLPITRLTHSLLPPLPHSMESSSLDLLFLSQFEINLSSIRPPSPSCLPFHCFIAEETGTDGRADGWTGGRRRVTTSPPFSPFFLPTPSPSSPPCFLCYARWRGASADGQTSVGRWSVAHACEVLEEEEEAASV